MKFARIHPIMSADIAKEGIKVCARPNIYWVEGGGVGSGGGGGGGGEEQGGGVQYLCHSLLMGFGWNGCNCVP